MKFLTMFSLQSNTTISNNLKTDCSPSIGYFFSFHNQLSHCAFFLPSFSKIFFSQYARLGICFFLDNKKEPQPHGKFTVECSFRFHIPLPFSLKIIKS